MDLKRLKWEIGIVLTVTFGLSGMKSILRLIDALLKPEALNEQQVTLYSPQSASLWLDYGLQLCSATALISWGLLALYLLAGDGIKLPAFRRPDIWHGMALAAIIGVPGLAFYFGALQLGLTKEVIPSDFPSLWGIPVVLIWSFANAFGEEVVVVGWFMTRLKSFGLPAWAILALSAVLRGSYHLYQGISGGIGNIIMGGVYGYYFQRFAKVWPLVIGHLLIDAIAFVGYTFIGPF
ncbi:CPBP family intramembrane glutamic endopeptidase [Corynebacterium sp. H127]|uniref:CPBP family intramembrane glutamic endopeptidase n=1 Tax=Corynebacterium sp. H127 TaxID=3133418 RepID=UPI0030A1CCC6